MKKFQRYLEHNLSRVTGPESETFIAAYKNGDPMRLMKFMDHTRHRKIEWWLFCDQPPCTWVKFRASYGNIHVQSTGEHVSTSILPYVREVERNQLQLQLVEPELAFCTSCYMIRTENEVLRKRIEELTGQPVVDEPFDREIVRAWFEENFHRNGFGRGYARKQMRKELNDFLATKYGYKTEIYTTSDLWKWFVKECINDTSSQYRGFRVWRKSEV